MKRQSIFPILLLSFILAVVCGCSASQKPDAFLPESTDDTQTAYTASSAEETAPEKNADISEKAATDSDGSSPPTEEINELHESSPTEENAELKELIETQQTAETEEKAENIVGVFEGLEDNHTAVFSFDGAERAFYFEAPAVQTVLNEAVVGSSYTLSYRFLPSVGLVCIYEIMEN